MFEKLAAHFRSSDTDYRLLVPLLISTMLVQVVTALVRVTTSYRAVELNLSIVWLGLIAPPSRSPILIAVRVGRQIDRGYDARPPGSAAPFSYRLRGLCVGLVAGGLLSRPPSWAPAHHADGEPAAAVCARLVARPGIGVRQLHGGRRHQGAGPYIIGWLGGAASVRRRSPSSSSARSCRPHVRRLLAIRPAPTGPPAKWRSFRSADLASPDWSAWCWRA
jgi:hypothetical protein